MSSVLEIREANLETQLTSVVVLLTWYWVVGGGVELGDVDWNLLFMEDILPGFLLAAQQAARGGHRLGRPAPFPFSTTGMLHSCLHSLLLLQLTLHWMLG
jgi:hypothetical protein